MRLNKKVIESTVVAGMLVTVTAITAVSSQAQIPASEIIAFKTESGVAGFFDDFASVQASINIDFSAVKVSREKTRTVTVAKAEETPQLTAEEQEWSTKLMANVEEALNVRTQPDENAELTGKLHRGDRADIVEQLDGWTHIVSGNVDGYVKSEYCLTGTEALEFAKEVCGVKATVLTTGLRIRQTPSEEAAVYGSVAEGDKLNIKTDAEGADGWVAVDYNGAEAYVKAEYVQVGIAYGAGITIEEEQAMIRAAQEKEAAEKAAQAAAQKSQATAAQQAPSATQNASMAASVDDVTLLGALIQCEAGSECYDGMVAVGAVVMNRVRSGAYPSSIYGVIYQGGQFTPAGSGKVASVIASGVSGSCIQAAQQAIGGYDNTGGALSFRRASSGISGLVIGNHVFF